MADGRHLENLSTNRNRLNSRALSQKVFIDSDLSCVRLLADAHRTCFDSFLSNTKLLRKQSKLGFSIELADKPSGFAESKSSRPPSFGSLTTAAPTFTNDLRE